MTHYSRTIAERDAALKEDMIRTIQVVEENSKPTKRWYHRFYKPKQQEFMFEIEGRPVFTEQELAERRAFLDGYSSGRVDGDAHKAYKAWKTMKDSEND